MKSGGGKNKGSSFERKIGEIISLWLSAGQRRDLLCRTVGSGAQFTSAFNRGHQAGLAGDLRSQDPLADKLCNKFVIECKHWRDLEIIRFLHADGELYKALLKVQQEGQTVGKHWMLIAKQNNRPALLLVPAGVGLTIPTQKINHLLFGGTVNLYFLDDFFETVSPEQFLK